MIKSFFSISEINGAFDLQVATSYLLQVDTAPAPHNDSPTAFRLDSVIDLPEFLLEALVSIKDLSKQEERSSRFKLKQETVAVNFFSKAEVGK